MSVIFSLSIPIIQSFYVPYLSGFTASSSSETMVSVGVAIAARKIPKMSGKSVLHISLAVAGKGNWDEDSHGGAAAALAVIGNGKSGDLTHFTYLLK